MENKHKIRYAAIFILLAIGGYQWYGEKQEKDVIQQELLQKYRNTPDNENEYSGGNRGDTTSQSNNEEPGNWQNGKSAGEQERERTQESSKMIICPNCKGTKEVLVNCSYPFCSYNSHGDYLGPGKGGGYQEKSSYNNGDRPEDKIMPCRQCNGTGKQKSICPVCKGTGRVAEYQ